MSRSKPIDINSIPCEFCGRIYDKINFIEHNKHCSFKYNNSYKSYNNKKYSNVLENYISYSYQIKGNSLKKFLNENEYYDECIDLDFNSDDDDFIPINNKNKSKHDNYSLIHEPDKSNKNECPICLEALNLNNKIRTTICFHSFCITCFVKWFEINNYCPICKEKIK